MIKIAICDDEVLVQDCVEDMLKKNYGDEVEITLYGEAETLLNTWEHSQDREDIVLMDIRFEQMDGISAARLLQEKHPAVKIIFITGYIEYATDIFRAEPVYFLTKPIRTEKLIEAVEKAKSHMKRERKNTLVCMVKGAVVNVEVNQIYYLESDRRQLHVHEGKETIVINQKLKDVEEQLPNTFVRCHQSFLVNMRYIRSFTAQEIELTDGRKVPVSRPRYGEAKEVFMKYLANSV